MVRDGPVVATFHTADLRSRTMQAAFPLLRPSLEKIAAASPSPRTRAARWPTHFGGDAVVIPNGVDVDRFAEAAPPPQFGGARPTRRRLAFLGRIDEPRKGLPGARGRDACGAGAAPRGARARRRPR